MQNLGLISGDDDIVTKEYVDHLTDLMTDCYSSLVMLRPLAIITECVVTEVYNNV